MNIRTLIVDDEDSSRKTLRQLLATYASSLHIIAEAVNTHEARRAMLEHAPDVMFLDIEMPDENGLDFLHTIHAAHRPFAVIIVTGFEKYALPAFHEHVFAYLLKPIDIDELRETVVRIQTEYMRRCDTLTVGFNPSRQASVQIPLHLLTGGVRIVSVNDLMYSSADGNYCRFYLSDKTWLMAAEPMKKYEQLLVHHSWLRIHRAYLVNPYYIDSYIANNNRNRYTGGSILLKGGIKLNVARRRKEDIVRHLTIYTQSIS